MNKIKLVSIFVATIILLSLVAPMLLIQPASAQAFTYEDYVVVNGVLDSDYYALYPFEKKSLKVGFSKYGELIGIPEGLNPNVQANWVGFEYDGRDPFCPPSVVSMQSWFNGWYIDIQYTDPNFPENSPKRDRNLWAFAMFSDGSTWGGDWICGATGPGEAPHGGRKTSGYAETEPLKILYDGPRLFVAESVTHLYDWDDGNGNGIVEHPRETWPVVDVVIKLIFEKVKKQVILLKDVKFKVPKSHIWDKLNIQLSNREQYDLGPAPGYASFADFFEQEGWTCYGPEWHVAGNLTRDYVEYQYGNGVTREFTLSMQPVAEGFIKIWIDGAFVDPTQYKVDWVNGKVTFAFTPKKEAEIKFMYKYVFKEEEQWTHVYDIAQVISSDKKYVAWTAFWPPVSDYVVDGMLRVLEPLIDVQEDDMWSEPKRSPVIIGEWDFLLDEVTMQYRCVEVKGIANLHDAADDEFGEPWIDREAWYQLDEVFNPWGLWQAVHKRTWRWVEFFTGDGATSYVDLKYELIRMGEWYSYWGMAERVLVDGVLLTPWDARISDNKGGWAWWPSFPYTYNIIDNKIYFLKDKDGKMTTIGDDDWKVEEGKVIKVLYSTFNPLVDGPLWWGRYEWTIVGRDSETVDSAGAAMVTAAFKDKIIWDYIFYKEWGLYCPCMLGGAEIGLSGADMAAKKVQNDMPWVMRRFGTGNTMADYKDSIGRAALKDDWCTTWPVASSAMIGVGGPLANLLAYYANDFTPALYGLPEYACDEWAGKIIALSCWSQNTYESTEETGYAVISTYKDLNGTVIFLIWGDWGRDTYYATKWFLEEGIWELQWVPCCTTALIIEIDYTVHEPTVSVVEVLGTISEMKWEGKFVTPKSVIEHCMNPEVSPIIEFVKGDIHLDP
ncbi:MAG: hypothetical protein QXT26_06515 [Thermoproteota archaeon]